MQACFARWCSGAGPQYRWARVLDRADLDRVARAKHGLAGLESLFPVHRNRAGHLEVVCLWDGKKKVVVERELKIRDALCDGQLRSGKFIAVPVNGAKGRYLVLLGAGFGHGAGLCQEGARGMGAKNVPFREILHHYFTDVELADYRKK